MAYLILIDQHSETDIDQALVIVPDEHDEKKLLETTGEWMTGEPFVAEKIRLDEPLPSGFSFHRLYIG